MSDPLCMRCGGALPQLAFYERAADGTRSWVCPGCVPAAVVAEFVRRERARLAESEADDE